MTNLLKNDWTLSTTTLCMHPLYMCIRTRLSACLSVFLWACVRAQEVGIALGHAGIFGPKGLVGERGKSAILTKRMPGKLNIMGDLPYLFCSSAARQNSWKDNKERKAGKPAKSCTAYGKVTRFPLLLFGLQLQTSVCVCESRAQWSELMIDSAAQSCLYEHVPGAWKRGQNKGNRHNCKWAKEEVPNNALLKVFCNEKRQYNKDGKSNKMALNTFLKS